MTEPPAESQAHEPVPKKERPLRSERREQAAADVLRGALRDLVERLYNRDDLPGEPFSLSLDLHVDPSDDLALSFAPALGDQLTLQLDDVTARHGAYMPGHAHCFRCRSSRCEHGVPPASTMVFDGYSATGVPQWKEMGQVLLDTHDDRAHLLYEKRPGTVTRVMTGKDLKAQQLGSFGKGSKTYAILGQVIAGYFLLPPGPGAHPSEQRRLAISYQCVEARKERGHVALYLNTVCRTPDETRLEDWFASGWGGWIQRAQRHAERDLKRMERTLEKTDGAPTNADRRKVLGRVPAVLSQLAASLTSGYRQSQRRTRHAEERRAERPIERALADTRVADPEDFLADEKTGNTVVRGRAGRYHVFTPEGKHVTSFKSGPDTVEFRVRTRRWRFLSDDEREEWQKIWQETLAGAQDDADGKESQPPG